MCILSLKCELEEVCWKVDSIVTYIEGTLLVVDYVIVWDFKIIWRVLVSCIMVVTFGSGRVKD